MCCVFNLRFGECKKLIFILMFTPIVTLNSNIYTCYSFDLNVQICIIKEKEMSKF